MDCHTMLVRLLSGAINVPLDEYQQLNSLHATYHKQWWCRLQMFYYFKRYHTILNVLTLLVLAASLVVGTVWKDSYAVVALTATATFIKGWSDFKKYSLKMDMCRFAYTTYEKTLIELKNYARGETYDRTLFLIKMQTLDDIITDFTPPILERIMHMYSFKFMHQ